MKQHLPTREDRILTSLDGLQKAQAPDYFYTRLIARMENELLPVRKPFFLLRPAFITTALFLVLVLNVISLTHFRKDKPAAPSSNETAKEPASMESFAKAYNLNDNLSELE